MLRLSTNASGPIAVSGGTVDMIGMDCRTAFATKTTFDSRVNCRRRDLGRKEGMLYLAVSILFPRMRTSNSFSRNTRD